MFSRSQGKKNAADSGTQCVPEKETTGALKRLGMRRALRMTILKNFERVNSPSSAGRSVRDHVSPFGEVWRSEESSGLSARVWDMMFQAYWLN